MFLDKLKDILLPLGMYVDKSEIGDGQGYEYFFEYPQPWSDLSFFFLRYDEPNGLCEFYPQYRNVNKFIYHHDDDENVLEDIKSAAITFKEGYEKRFKRYKKSLLEKMKMKINEDFV